MASNRPHAYHLPSELELAQTELIIAHRREQIKLIDQSIENERVLLDAKTNKLDTTYAPSIAKIKADLQKLIEREEGKIAVLNKKKALEGKTLKEATERKIAAWERRRADLDKEIGNDKGFIAPIRRLPSELLSEVFIWSEINGNPWPLTKVCRSWRSVALRTPQIWGHIILTETRGVIKSSYGRIYSYADPGRRLKTAPSDEPGREGSQRCKTVKGLETAVKLAGSTPLRITISIGNPESYSYYDDDAYIRKQRIEILGLLTHHFPRIQSLVIRNLPDLKKMSEFEGQFASVFQGKLPLLEELEVNMGTRNIFINALMASAQATSRNLKSLTYTQPSGLWGNLDVLINVKLNKEVLSGLTSLRLGNGPLPFEKACWEAMPNLRELEFAGHTLDGWSALPLPNLVRLTISGGTATNLGGHLPRLKYLTLDSVTLNAAAFSISAPALEVLMINDRLEAARMIEAPNLESLDICSKFLKKTDANILVAMLWDDTGTAEGRCLNPRRLRVDVDANDPALAKAVKVMDRIEDLQVGVRAKMNCRKKFLGDLALKAKRTAKGVKEGVPILCPNLKRVEVFPGQWTHREGPISGPGDRLQIQNLLDGITAARPGVECVLKEEHHNEIFDMVDLFWDY